MASIAVDTNLDLLGRNRAINVQDGVNPQDVATVAQLQVAVTGLKIKDSVKAASTGNLTLSGTQTVDTVALAVGDRVLVKNQTTASANGIYVVAAGAWVRAKDFDAWSEIPGSLVAVEQGSAFPAGSADIVYLATADRGGTLDTTAVTFSPYGAPAAAGPQKFAANITGDGAATSFTVTHGLGTTDVQVAVYDVANDLLVLVEVKRPTGSTVGINFNQAPANNKVYRVVVVG